jgi:peptidoglycan/LPS O-acetylase OafA/YrhL
MMSEGRAYGADSSWTPLLRIFRMVAESGDTGLDHGHRRTFLTLEGLRGISAMAVVFGHAGGAWPVWFRHSYLAVDLFFLMSGVVIAHAYEKRLQNDWSLADFVGARVKRLAPLYFVGLIVGVICALIAHRFGYVEADPIAINLTLGLIFVPVVFGPGDLYPLNPPCWSLFNEAIANLAYAAIASSLADRTLKMLICLGLVALCVVVRKTHLAADIGVNSATWIGGIARVSFSFPLGVLIHRLYSRGRLKLPRVPAPLLLAGAIATFVTPIANPLYDLMVIIGFYPCLVALALNARPGRHANAALFAAAGALSYPLYILHYPLVHPLRAFVPGNDSLNALISFGSILASLVLAYLAYAYVDHPLQLWLKGIVRPRVAVTGRSVG